MQPRIFHTQVSSEFYTPERCHIIEVMNQEGIGFSIARARIEPGITTQLHRLSGTWEAYYILSGRGSVQTGQEENRSVVPGDIVLYSPHTPQCITNTGEFDLIFLCICIPRFKSESYVNLEDSI